MNIFYFHKINLYYPQKYVKRKEQERKKSYIFILYEYNEHCSQNLF